MKLINKPDNFYLFCRSACKENILDSSLIDCKTKEAHMCFRIHKACLNMDGYSPDDCYQIYIDCMNSPSSYNIFDHLDKLVLVSEHSNVPKQDYTILLLISVIVLVLLVIFGLVVFYLLSPRSHVFLYSDYSIRYTFYMKFYLASVFFIIFDLVIMFLITRCAYM